MIHVIYSQFLVYTVFVYHHRDSFIEMGSKGTAFSKQFIQIKSSRQQFTP